MIVYLTSGKGITVINNGPSMPYISQQTNNPLIGSVKYNTNSQNLEVYDGYGWLPIPKSTPTISLDQETINVLEWAKSAMQREKEIEELSKEYPMIADLQEKMDLVIQLVKDHKGG